MRGDTEPTATNLLALAFVSGLHPHWLLTGDGPKKVVDAPYVPEEGDVSSSFEVIRSVAVEHEDHDEAGLVQRIFELRIAFTKKWLDENGLSRRNLFLYLARDDSMSPSINPGDTLLISGYYPEQGDHKGLPGFTPDPSFSEEGVFYVWPEGGKHAIRRLQSDLEGGFLLSTDNVNRPDIKVPANKLRILGRVEWIGRRL